MNDLEPSTSHLFASLEGLGLKLDTSCLRSYAKIFDTPEDLCHHLAHHIAPQHKAYFLVLMKELWQRQLSKKD